MYTVAFEATFLLKNWLSQFVISNSETLLEKKNPLLYAFCVNGQ